MSIKKLVTVFVIDMYDIGNNGTTMTARRTAENLRMRGHEVRIVSTGTVEPGKFVVSKKWIPIVSHFAKRENFIFGKGNRKIFKEAFQNADIVHLFLPMALEKQALKVARQMRIPCSTAFHLQPENMIYLKQRKILRILSNFIYHVFYVYFYKNFSHIHCPSQFIADQLREYGYQAKLHVISNGIPAAFHPIPEQHDLDGKFHILSVGRFSPEKRQILLIEAAQRSAHREKIQLHFAGHGPEMGKLYTKGQLLPNPPTFGYYSQSELIKLMNASDLYVHPSDIEIEAISCLEAIACGLVPIISNSDQSATPQFALNEKSLFKAGDVEDLTKKIDYWIDHAEERKTMSAQYTLSAERYGIEKSIDLLETMFKEVIEDER